MKQFMIALLLVPSFAFAGNYTYTKVTSIEAGNDNFNVTHCSNESRTGTILLEKRVLKIDDKEFRLKSTAKRNVYKIKGGVAKLIYTSADLTAIELYQFNQVAKYRITK
jgi:hypothetical protein